MPTGNFGNIYAAYSAQKMGLPVDKLILATNENDILYRTLTSGLYKTDQVYATLSPSMDIQISSNFERFLFYLSDQDGDKVEQKMTALRQTGQFQLSAAELSEAQSVFSGMRVDTEDILNTMKDYYRRFGIILDPHTAVGVSAAEKSSYPKVISLATAHPAKFAQAVKQAINQEPDIPEALMGISDKKSRCITCEPDYQEVEKIIESVLNN